MSVAELTKLLLPTATMQSRCLVRHHSQVCSGVALDLSRVPVEVLELILSKLTDPVSQRRLAQVTWNIVTE